MLVNAMICKLMTTLHCYKGYKNLKHRAHFITKQLSFQIGAYIFKLPPKKNNSPLINFHFNITLNLLRLLIYLDYQIKRIL